MKEEILNIPTPFGEPLILYKNRWGPEYGDTLSIVSGLQGDRLNGLMVASRLSRFLNDVEAGKETGYQIRGGIQIFPIVNYKAWETGNALWNLDSQDTELTFPGMAVGELTETICNTVIRHTAESEYGIILQTGERHYEDAPHVKLIDPGRKRRKLSRALGLPIGREAAESPSLVLNLAKQWDLMGLHPFILSAGKPQTYHPQYCDLLLDGIINFLRSEGLLSHKREKSSQNEMVFFDAPSELPVLTSTAGLFYPESVLGTSVVKGQKLGEVRDLYQGTLMEEIVAPENGIAVTLREQPMVHEKELVAVLLRGKNQRWFWPFG
ncbi:MAG: succinylglutamate desuccinylase/aspartoacylase family protein [Nitrospinota bacterium]|nr:succinylglutamate desuccinylase/aspartoacylase family protein [Nitrospinota bacterium]